ncbi:MAG: caspase family protein [Microcoleaceae cyanobacterium MO_207.B10]|nr:caspase family protein [Microcoleaceae cyanobacterium MO_207.B10]
MKNYICIAIGINQYEFIEPLSYAQQDAEALHNLLLNEVNFSPEQCLILSDNTSRPMWEQPTYPSRENILELIEDFCQNQLKPEDVLWFFFSGYAINYDRQDYLMPIDGNPNEVAATGISIRKLLENLKKSPVKEVLVLLDINRSNFSNVDDKIGTQGFELAEELEIPLLLSCRPNQVSYETSAIRLGFFTAALMEGVSSGKCNTLKDLNNFLAHRLPELCAQHLRPQQNLLIGGNSPEKNNIIILPQKNQNHYNRTEEKVGINFESPVSLAGTKKQIQSQATTTYKSQTTKNSMVNGHKSKNNLESQNNSEKTEQKLEMSENITQNLKSDKSFLQKLIVGSGFTAVLLLSGVFLTNKSIFLAENEVGNLLQIEDENTSLEVNSSPKVSSSQNQSPKPTTISLSSSQKLAESQTSATNKLLAEAKASFDSISASSFSKAIIQVSQIPKNDPVYPEAQAKIERWSLTILDIATSRAIKGNYDDAIAAAKLVPQTLGPIYQEAQLAIAEWQQEGTKQKKATQESNEALLKAAKEKIKPGQASSYIQAINQVRKIVPGDPSYEEAQKLIADWSQTIFNIAQVRAKNNNISEAILAAELVPSGTPVYQSAQQKLADWKSQQQKNNKKN